MFRKGFITKVLFLILASLFVLSCTKSGSGCIKKDHTKDSLNSKGAFGNFLGSTIIRMVTQGIYGDARFWDKNKFFNGSQVKIKEGTFRSGDNPSLIYTTYTTLIGNYQVKLVIALGLVMYVAFLGVGIIMGTKELKIKDLAEDIFRISVVMLFTSKVGWTAYFNLIIKPIVLGGYWLGTQFVLALDPTSEPTPFGGIDTNLSFILSWPAIQKFVGLLLSGLYGTFTAIVLLYAIFSFLIMNLKGIVIFASNCMICGFLLCSGPIFIILLLFDKTKDFFKNWFAAVVSTGLQQMTIFVTLVFINHIGSGMIKAALFYEVCWSNVLSMKIQIPMPGFIKSVASTLGIDIPSYIINITVPLINFFLYLSTATNPPPDFLGSIGALIIFSLIAGGTIMDIGIKIATKMSEFSISSSDTGMAKSASQALNAAHSKIGDTAKSLGGAAIEHARMQTIGRINGENKQSVIKSAERNQKVIDELNTKKEKDGKLSVSDRMRLAKAKAGLAKDNLDYKTSSLSMFTGFNLKDAKSDVRDIVDKSRRQNMQNDLTINNSNKFSKLSGQLSNENSKEAIEHNREIIHQHFGDVADLISERAEIEKSQDINKINAFNKRLAGMNNAADDDLDKNGKFSINSGGTTVNVDGLTKMEQEATKRFFGIPSAIPLPNAADNKDETKAEIDSSEDTNDRDKDVDDLPSFKNNMSVMGEQPDHDSLKKNKKGNMSVIGEKQDHDSFYDNDDTMSVMGENPDENDLFDDSDSNSDKPQKIPLDQHIKTKANKHQSKLKRIDQITSSDGDSGDIIDSEYGDDEDSKSESSNSDDDN